MNDNFWTVIIGSITTVILALLQTRTRKQVLVIKKDLEKATDDHQIHEKVSKDMSIKIDKLYSLLNGKE